MSKGTQNWGGVPLLRKKQTKVQGKILTLGSDIQGYYYKIYKTKIKPEFVLENTKVHIFREGHKILWNLHLTFDWMYCSQKLGEDFAKFCGLLRLYEL